jgi:GNAT superfamily N-acetyltransferase
MCEGAKKEAATMPMRSQHFPISFEEWERLPRPPGWKHEYFDGCAHITPSHQHALTTAAVAPRPVNAPCALRPVVPEDEASLLAVYLEAFADDPVFCDYSDEQFCEAAMRDLHESFAGRRAPLLAASHVAVAADAGGAHVEGAALLSADREYGPVLDLLFVRPAWQRRGLATALVASAMNDLHRDGERTLTSSYHLANLTSQAWHRAFGFVERPDLRYAQAYYRHARHELSRREASGGLTTVARAALQAEIAYWRDQVAALERLAEEQDFWAAYPRLPHW